MNNKRERRSQPGRTPAKLEREEAAIVSRASPVYDNINQDKLGQVIPQPQTLILLLSIPHFVLSSSID